SMNRSRRCGFAAASSAFPLIARVITVLRRLSGLMEKLKRTVAYSLAIIFLSGQSITLAQSIDGFSAAQSQNERRIEEQFRAAPQSAGAREELRRLTAEAHIAGSPEDYATAVYVRDQMRGFGLQSELREYQVLLPYPRVPSIVELVAPRRERLQVREDVVSQDPTSASRKIVPLYNGY